MDASTLQPVAVIGDRSVTGMPITAVDMGNKAANLSRLDRLGLRVPPAVALSTSFCRSYFEHGEVVDLAFPALLAGYLRRLEDLTGRRFGGRRPLLVSVRSSPPLSMPGMLDTILNVGLNESTVRGMIRTNGNPALAWDAYRRLIRSFAETVHNLPPHEFERATAAAVAAAGVSTPGELDPLSLRAVARDSAELFHEMTGASVPVDPLSQIVSSIEAVWRSWNSPRAREYRRIHGLDSDTGTGVIVQAMVFGNASGMSGSGVGFTRNPADGGNELYVDFLFNAQGEDVVSGRQSRSDAGKLQQLLPDVWTELQRAKSVLEAGMTDMQDFEFTVQDGRLCFLQTRSGKRTPWAALQIAVDLVQSGIIEPRVALERLEAIDLESITRSRLHEGTDATVLAVGIPASPGVVTGQLALSSPRAREMASSGPVILVRNEISPDDISGLDAAVGVLTKLGGRTSHAAVVTRQMGKSCVVGCQELSLDPERPRCVIGGRVFREGDVLTLDGGSGKVYGDRIEVLTEIPRAALDTVATWRRRMSEGGAALEHG